MEKWPWNEWPTGVSEGRGKTLLSTTLGEGLENSKDFDQWFMNENNFLTSNNGNCEKYNTIQHKQATRGKANSLKSAAKTEKAKTLATSVGDPEKQHIPEFPWKWDLPDIQSSPMERRMRRKEITKTNKMIGANCMTPEIDEKLKDLNAEISWIFEESSESDTEISNSNAQQQNKEEPKEKKGPFDEKFRDHLMKELLKQGKDMKWFVTGGKKALDNLEKGQHADVPGIKSAVKVSQELNQFLTKSMRPYYQEKSKGKRTKQKQQNTYSKSKN